MRLRLSMAATLSVCGIAQAAAQMTGGEFRSKPGAPRPPAPVVGAESGVHPPGPRIDAEIGASTAGAPTPEGLRATFGAADYGFSPMREAEGAEAPPLGGAQRSPLRMPWPNK
ncbi:MAG: hypothetical protein AAFN79_21385 [Pseudomonadota bacterium]